MKKFINKVAGALIFALPVIGMTSCSDSYMEDINTDKTKPTSIDPNYQLTSTLLQTYGDFQLMDTHRCYTTGFTQHFMGGWNVANYAGSVHAENDMTRQLWDELYSVGIKNLVDAICLTDKGAEKEAPYLNAMLRIHRVYIISVLTDSYGDVPCSEAGLGLISGISLPKYDKQEDIYNWMFEELANCIKTLTSEVENPDNVTGDVTSYGGSRQAWAKYANSLRMRYAMRVSDAAPELAKQQFLLSMKANYISSPAEDALIQYMDGPFTLYDGARDHDFRVNALGESLYGQDPSSPTFVCATFFNYMYDRNDPRLYRICRHYINTKRSQDRADDQWNVDVTDDVVKYLEEDSNGPVPCWIGAAWWNEWVSAPANDKIPALDDLVKRYPDAGFDSNNYNVRMLRPFLSIQFEKGNCPGVLMTAAEVQFLLAEAACKGWISGSVDEYYENGIRFAMQHLNNNYGIEKITEDEISEYIASNPVGRSKEDQKENINGQAWILHFMNPAEAWANLRRSDYPKMEDRKLYPQYLGDFTYDDTNMQTPTRLIYPNLEYNYNRSNYLEALERMGTPNVDDWHKHVWWDKHDINLNPEQRKKTRIE